MSVRRHLFTASIAFAILLAAVAAPTVGQSVAQLPPQAARLVVEVYLEHARNGGVGTEFLSEPSEFDSDWLVLRVNPEWTTYCIAPDTISGDCYLEPHTLYLAVFVGNKHQDRSVSVQLRAVTPALRAADSDSLELPTVDNVKLSQAPFRYTPSHPEDVPTVWAEVLVPPQETRRVPLIVGFDESARSLEVLTFELMAVPLTEPNTESDGLPSSDGPEGK